MIDLKMMFDRLFCLPQNLLNSQVNSKERVGLETNFSALICSSEELPPVCELTPGLVRKTSNYPLFGQSGMFDIYRGVCYNKIEVAIKVWRHVTIDQHTKRVRDFTSTSFFKTPHLSDCKLSDSSDNIRTGRQCTRRTVGSIFSHYLVSFIRLDQSQ